MDGVNVCLETYLPEQPAIFPEEVSARPHQAELPRGDCFADSTPLGFNALLQGAAHLGRLTGFACKSFSIVNPRGRQLKALCRQLRVWKFFWSLKCGIRVVLKPSGVESAKQSPRGSSILCRDFK